MRVLLSWLREFAPIEGDAVELGEHLSDLGMAVEEMTLLGQGLDGIVVAKVLDLRAHPDADRIQIVDVDAGDGEALQICCGAFNMSVGDLVPLATLGTTMPNGMEIARRKMRGEWSNGMLCAPDEIGLGTDHEGILIMDADHALGTPITEALGIEADVLYDLEINPNRPDALSVVGVARDLAARLGVPFDRPIPDVATTATDASALVDVEILDPQLCGRFVARVLENVSIGESPGWMANRLLAMGMRPINSVVDISNYVMLETGQPNHTFDLDKVPGGSLRVRRAVAGETLETLDGLTRELVEGDGVITDRDDNVVSLAGVMGGLATEISASTSSVLLEMAWWDPPSIARTSRRLALRSEASARFERVADPEAAAIAMLRFAQLLGESGATLASGAVDVAGDAPVPATVRVRTDRVGAVLGAEITQAQIRSYLEPIGFAVHDVGPDQDVVVPSFRPDTSTEIDVVEEVARHHGYSNIPRTVPTSARAGSLTDAQLDRRRIRALMIGLGATEAMPLPFLAPDALAKAGLSDNGIRVINPLAAEESIMRSSLRPGLLHAISYNESHRSGPVSLFELGHVYGPVPDGQQLPDEREHLALAMSGCEAPAAVEAWELVAERLDLPAPGIRNAEMAGLHPTRAAELWANGERVGSAGEVDPGVLAAYSIGSRVAWLEVDVTTVAAMPHGEGTYVAFSKYPSSDVDLAFVVDESVPAATVAATLRESGGELVVDVRLFDVFRSEALGTDRRSLAYTLRFQAGDRTLTDVEVGEVRQRCIDAVESAHGAELRG